MTITAALEEAYASDLDDGIVLNAAEINSPGFDEPIRVISGIDGPLGDPDVLIFMPIVEGGERIGHVPCAFSFTPPGSDEDGPTDASVTIDNVSSLLYPHLRAALGYAEGLTITFRQYVVTPGGLDSITGPDEEIAGLELKNVKISSSSAEGTLSWPDSRRQNVPTGDNGFFDRDNYPALFS